LLHNSANTLTLSFLNDPLGLEKILIQTKYKQALENDESLRKDKGFSQGQVGIKKRLS
jgi:hypothetical protein